MKEFKVGDVVVLNSGGPPMTVTKVYPNYSGEGVPEIDCVWIEENIEHEHCFSMASVMEFKSGLTTRVKE
jgi:uncharacterized protein YodC (DUF2158 family)